MKAEEYILTTAVGSRDRKRTWHTDEAVEVDVPHGWELRLSEGRLRFRDKSAPPEDQIAREVVIDPPPRGETARVDLPAAEAAPTRNLTVELRHMRPLKPIYVDRLQWTFEEPAAGAPTQLCIFYGQRYFLVRYRPISKKMMIMIGPLEVFTYERSGAGYVIVPRQAGMKIKVAGPKIPIVAGQPVQLSVGAFFNATFVLGVHWWRFGMVPTPDALPPIVSDETEEQLFERERLRTVVLWFVGLFCVASAALIIGSHLVPDVEKPPQAEVEIKQPKIMPAPTPPPQPTPAPTPEPTPAPTPTPPPAKPTPPPKAEPKPKPRAEKPKSHKAEPKAKPAAKKPEKVVAEPPPKPEPKVPTPEQVAAQKAAEKAAEDQAQQQQLMKSLSFISTSSKRTSEPKSYEKAEGRFSDQAVAGGLKSTSSKLDSIVKGAAGDGNIRTSSARGVGGDIKFKGRNKGLNDVQGKVSLGGLGKGTGFAGLGGKGVEVSGQGTLSDSAIEKALAKFLSRFQYCYEKSLLSDASLGGQVTVKWTITESGKTSGAKVVKSAMNNEALHSCIIKVLGEVPFPKPKGGAVEVKKAFSFSSSAL